MLTQGGTITASSSIGNSQYTATILFSDSGKAGFTRVGDTLVDKDGFQYRIDTWVGHPNDFTSSGSVTVTFITADQAPAIFGGFGNAQIFTPNQQNFRPAVLSAGQIQTSSPGSAPNSGQLYQYDITCVWFDGSAINAAPSHQVLDSVGKCYNIITTTANGTELTVEECLKEGDAPDLGESSLYVPTENYGLFRGTPVSDPARTLVRNRDNVLIDNTLGSGGSGSSNGDWQQIFHTVSASEIIAKKFTLAFAPADITELGAFIPGGSALRLAVDYTIINGNEFNWDSLDLDGILEESDVIMLLYFS